MKLVLALAVAGMVLVACGDDDDDEDATGTPATATQQAAEEGELSPQVASYEIVASQPGRIIVGLVTNDQRFVSFGSVQMAFSYLGTRDEPVESPEVAMEGTGRFLPVYGEGPAMPPSEPQVGPASQGRGVYAVEPITFDRAGFWQVDVRASVAGEEMTGRAAFEVFAEPGVPAPGEPAPRSENYTLATPGVAPGAVDSRALSQGSVPDPELHQMTIAQAIDSGRPTLVVFSTPVFCVSQFCGPVTDMVAELQRTYGDRVNFIHVEVWEDFQAGRVAPTVLDWVTNANGDPTEPWFFLIGRDGVIRARWDNLAVSDEIVPALEQAIAS